MTQTPPPPSGQQPWTGRGSPQAGPGPATPGAEGPHTPSGHQGYAAPHGYTPPPGYGVRSGGPAAPVDGDERTMMLLAHLSAPVSLVLSGGWLPFLGPLLIWLFYKDKSQAVRIASAGAFNYNITMTLVSWALWVSVFLTFFIGLLWAVPIWIAMVIPHIIGVVKASNGQVYDYPFQIRLLS